MSNKEDFCMACAVLPLAFAGAGASAYGASSKGQYKKRKKYILWGGVITVLISIIIIIYYLKTCKNCTY